MTKEFAFLARCIGLLLILVLSLFGCIRQTVSPPKRIIYGASTPTAAVKGFIEAVKGGNTRQAVAYWEFPKKGEPGYERTRDYVHEEDISRQSRQGVLEGVTWSAWSPLSVGPSLRQRKRMERLLEWHFTVELFNVEHTRGAPSLEAAGWATVAAEGTLRDKEYAAYVLYDLHKSEGRWRLVQWVRL